MMKTWGLFILVMIFVPVWGWAESTVSNGAAMTVFHFEKDKTYYFGSDWEKAYYEFGKDGKYRLIKTDDYSSGEADEGSWMQMEDGRLRLISQKRFHDLYSDIMYISVYTGKDLERVARVKEILRNYLDREKRDEFARFEIENLLRYQTKGNVSHNVIGVVPRRLRITRAELEKFLTDIDAYLQGEAKSVFYMTPYLYQSNVLLAIPSDLLDDSDAPVKIRQHIDSASGPYKWADQIIAIDQKDFESATADYRYPYKNELLEEDQGYRPKSQEEVAAVRASLQVYHFPKGEDAFFAESGAHTIYLALRADGSYRESESAHVGIAQTDAGKWEQDSDGIVRLISEKRYHDICAGWMEVLPYDAYEVNALEELKELIRGFLESRKENRFTRKEVMAITKDARAEGSMVPDIGFFLSADFATRQNLEELLTQIDAYIPSEEKNVFKMTPYRYKAEVILLPEDILSGLEDVVEYFDHGWYPSFVYVAIDKKTFEKGSKKPQPFRFFPEMNKKIKGKKKK
ncbi:MAG: hypothetical protein PHN49_07525 [Candidatus Omnitrophica bacterium]|nr:hypothetical protein [Candidatus Omnitrophota bacterium]